MKPYPLIDAQTEKVFSLFLISILLLFIVQGCFLFRPEAVCALTYTLEGGEGRYVSLTVEVTPDTSHYWSSDINYGGAHIYNHIMTFEPGELGQDPDKGPQITITVTAEFTGPEGSGGIESFTLNPTGDDIKNEWEALSEYSYAVEVGVNSLCPVAPDPSKPWVHKYTFKLNINGLVNYTDYSHPNQDPNKSATFDDHLIMGEQLMVYAGTVPSSYDKDQQLSISVKEIDGFGNDGLNVKYKDVSNFSATIDDAGPFYFAFTDWGPNFKNAHFNMTALLTSDTDTYGNINGEIKISAKDGNKSGNLGTFVSLPFARATRVNPVVKLMSRVNGFIDPRELEVNEKLFPGDALEVIGGPLSVRFCNGQSVGVPDSQWGTRIVLGKIEGGIVLERSSIFFKLKNLAYNVQNDPRGYGKVVLIDGLSEAIANVVAPGSGSVANWVFNKAAENGTNYILKKVGDSRAPQNALLRSADADTSSLSNQESYTVVNLFPDDKILVTPVKGMVSLDAGGTAQATLPEGSSTVGDMARSDAYISTPGTEGYTINNLWMGLSARWSPADGSEIHTRTPDLWLSYDSPLYTTDCPINRDYLEIRLNGTLITNHGEIGNNTVEVPVPESLAFHAGSNLLEGFLMEANRSVRHQISATLNVAEDAFAAPPDRIEALAYSAAKKTVLRWSPSNYPDIAGYDLERSESENGPFVLIGQQRYPQPVWLDDWTGETPTAPYWYRVRSVYTGGEISDWSNSIQMVEATREYGLPLVTPANLQLQAEYQGIRVLFDDSWPATVFWKLERSEASGGLWEDLLNGQYLCQSGYLDKKVTAGKQYWYRLAAYSILGDSAAPVYAGPALYDGKPAPPTGLTCYQDGNSVELRWDPPQSNTLSGFRIYRDAGSGFQFLNTVNAGTFIYKDWISEAGEYRWMVKSVNTNGIESQEGVQSKGYRWIKEGPAGTVNLGTPVEQVNNGNRSVSVPVNRVQGSSGAVFVTITMNIESNTGTEIVSRYAGTVVLENGETEKVVTIPVEDGYHFYQIYVSGVFGAETNPTYSGTFYVSSNGDCGTKTPCYRKIQDAIDDAVTGSVIKVKGGTYEESLSASGGRSILIKGGYDSNEYDHQAPNMTIIDAPGPTTIKASSGSLKSEMINVK